MKNYLLNEYSPVSDLRQPKRLLSNMFLDLWRGRGLAWRLFLRDIKAQYRQTLLGLLWVFLPPLATTFVFVLLNNAKLLDSPDGVSTPYPVFVLIGTLCWQTFADALNSPLRVLRDSGSMLVKINFPRESLIMAALLHAGFNSLVRLIILVPVFIFFDIFLKPTAIMFLLPLFVLLFLGIVIGVILSPLGILFHDIEKSLPLFLNFWMLLTPVIYTAPSTGLLGTIIKFNPISPLVVTGRDWILNGSGAVDLFFLLIAAATMFFAFFGWLIFRLSLPIIIERMHA